MLKDTVYLELIGAKVISKRLCISTETARKMIKKGLFGPPVACGSGSVRNHYKVPKTKFLNYLSKKGNLLSNSETKQLRLWHEFLDEDD